MKDLVPAATPEELEPLGRLLEEQFGLRLTLGNRDLIDGGLRLLAAELNLPAGVLLRRLLAGEDGLLHRLAVKTVVSETYFFRHPEHFDLLVERLVPALLQEGRTTLRAWSAGCATGEEAYSLAAALLAAAPRTEIAVLGTDLSEDSLAIAAAGRYGRRALRSELPRWSIACPLQVGPRSVEVPAALRALTRFQPLNLNKESYPEEVAPTSGFDIIFCRNVLIYFSPEGAANVLLRLRDRLREGGYLILAALDYTAALPGLQPLNLDGIPVLRRHSAVAKAAAPSRRTPPKRTPADIKKEARAAADCGDYELATRVLRSALRIQRAPELLHLLALIHKERGEL
ncbi:MAG TPA: CheR family methyltransferase, partial [Pseudomonadota bacterium]|nr:CheR family methyltransferase [Pseudomonadota bacterium]